MRLVLSVINAAVRVFSMLRSLFRSRSTQPAPRAERSSAKTPRATTTTSPRSRPAPDAAERAPRAVGSDGGIPDLFRQQRSDVVVTASGRVVKVLPDDLDDSDGSGQHQRFLVELLDRDATTVKVAHNLKFGRVPAREGTIVSFRGEYEFTEQGGTIHWTHHDPKKWHEDGWIEIDGKKYG